MYKIILTNKVLPWKKRLKRVVEYFIRKRSTRIQWNNRNKEAFGLNPVPFKPIEKSIEKAHREYWQGFQKRVNLATLRSCTNNSEKPDHRYVPEEIYRNDIEPTLHKSASLEYLQYKSLFNRLFPAGVFPADYLHIMNGECFDSNYNSISFDELIQIAQGLHYPLVCKPSRDSGSGQGVVFPKNATELVEAVKNKPNMVVQEYIVQHPFFNQFNPDGINSLRVNVYRSVTDNKQHVLNMTLRMGVGGSLDNISAGGIAALIKEDGTICGYALDKNSTRHLKHPDTGVTFDQQIPDIEGIRKIAIQVAQELYYTRLVALDICYDQHAKWRVIEVNLFSGTLKFPQYYGVPFFGEFTDEIRDYCLSHHWALS